MDSLYAGRKISDVDQIGARDEEGPHGRYYSNATSAQTSDWESLCLRQSANQGIS